MGVTASVPSVVSIMTATAIRDAILSLPDGDRKIIISRPLSGQKEVVAIQRATNGKIINECLDIPEPQRRKEDNMAIEKVYLDPNAVAYTDDEIVGKVNTATGKITRADAVEIAAVLESATEKLMSDTEKTKLSGIEEGADANVGEEFTTTEKTKLGTVEDSATADQSPTEVRDAIVGLADDDREILISRPTSGQKKIYAVQTHTDGMQEIEQSDIPES